MLGLQLPTDPRWVNLAEKSLEDILTDHAYCEQKAATSCISLIQLFSDKDELVRELAPIVTEEWGHFRMVLHELDKRKLKLGRQRKDEYVGALLNFKKKAVAAKVICSNICSFAPSSKRVVASVFASFPCTLPMMS